MGLDYALISMNSADEEKTRVHRCMYTKKPSAVTSAVFQLQA